MAKSEISSDVSIRNLKLPIKGQIDIKVKNAPALYLRLSPGAKIWYLRARPPGENNPLAMRMAPYGQGDRALTLKQAKAKAQQWKEDIAGGIDPRTETRIAKDSTYGAVIEEFLKRGKTTKGEDWKSATAKGYRSSLTNPRFKKWNDLPVAKVTEANVQEIINKLEAEEKYTAARRTLTYLKTFFGWCRRKKQGYIPISQSLPTDGIELEQSGDNARERHLSSDEIKIFWRATERLDYPWKHYYQLAILTGQRVGNVAGIKRSDVKDGMWTQVANKADRPLLVPISPMTQAVLDDCPMLGEYFLTTNIEGPIHQSSKAKKRLDSVIDLVIEEDELSGVFVESWVNHDLRRTLTTQLRSMRIPRIVCSKILNHAEQGVTAKNYDMYEMLDEKIQAMNAWSDYMQELLKGKSKKVVRIKA